MLIRDNLNTHVHCRMQVLIAAQSWLTVIDNARGDAMLDSRAAQWPGRLDVPRPRRSARCGRNRLGRVVGVSRPGVGR